MKRTITAVLTAAALAVAPGAQALGVSVTPKKAETIAKRVFDREIARWEASRAVIAEIAPTVEHAATANHATTAAHATTAGHSQNASLAVNANHATTASYATTADRAANVDHATTAGSATSAETAEVADVAVAANPMAYAYVTKDGFIDGTRSSGGIRSSGGYCYSAPRPKSIQVTVDYSGTYSYFGGMRYPFAVAGLGPGEDCPAGTEFYVKVFSVSTNGQPSPGPGAFFLSLVL
jgi:hypothetical protein